MCGNTLSLVAAPNYYREIRLRSLLDHEVGTHYVRGKNHANLDPELKEKIAKKRIGWQLATEEGVATISN